MTTSKLKNIVFIEDDPLDYEVYESILETHLPLINVARYEKVDKSFYSKYPASNTLILLDINLNGVHGVESFKKDLKSHHYTVYTHTSSDNPADIEKCKEAGINAYFQKQSGKKEIEDLLLSIIKFYEYNLFKNY